MNALEERVKAVFEEVFRVEDPDVNATFSELGGKSIDAMKLQIEMRKRFGVKVDFRTLYERGSAVALAAYLTEQGVE